MATTLVHLECSRCGKARPHDRLQNLCACGGPLLARYDLTKAAKELTREALRTRPATMWRYAELRPGSEPALLGEGLTPLARSRMNC